MPATVLVRIQIKPLHPIPIESPSSDAQDRLLAESPSTPSPRSSGEPAVTIFWPPSYGSPGRELGPLAAAGSRSLSDGHTLPRLVRYEKAGHNRGTFRNEPPAGSVSWKCALARLSRSRSSKPGARSVCPHLVQWSSYHSRSRNPWVIASCHRKPGDRPAMRHVSSWCPPCLPPFPGDQSLFTSAVPSRAEDGPGVLHRQEPHVPGLSGSGIPAWRVAVPSGHPFPSRYRYKRVLVRRWDWSL